MYTFGPETNPECRRVEVPVGRRCSWCREPIEADDSGVVIPYVNDFDGHGRVRWEPEHSECFLRSIIGSVWHVKHQCGCYVKGMKETDPPELTRREAAKLAVEVWREMNPVRDEE